MKQTAVGADPAEIAGPKDIGRAAGRTSQKMFARKRRVAPVPRREIVRAHGDFPVLPCSDDRAMLIEQKYLRVGDWITHWIPKKPATPPPDSINSQAGAL